MSIKGGGVAEDHQFAAVQSAAAQLARLSDTEPRIIPEPDATRIETDVTPHLTRHWPQVVEVLDLGAEYGLTPTPSGQVAWLRIPRETGNRP